MPMIFSLPIYNKNMFTKNNRIVNRPIHKVVNELKQLL